MKLDVGRTVHVRGLGDSRCFAALVTEVHRSASADYGRVVIFSSNGPYDRDIEDDAGRIWHDPRECPHDGGAAR